MSKKVASQDKAPGNLLVALKEAQAKHGCLSPDFMAELSDSLDVPVNDVYGVATFYSFLATRPKGRHIIRVCKSVPCFLNSSDTLIDSIRKELGVEPGETTADGRFSFELTNCIGACDKAPAMMIDNDVHGEVDRDKIAQILKEYE